MSFALAKIIVVSPQNCQAYISVRGVLLELSTNVPGEISSFVPETEVSTRDSADRIVKHGSGSELR
jgi:hypothetical protein